jgi:DNA-binding GntR family transcriptional regulator
MPPKASRIEQVYSGIKQEILAGLLLPGQRADVADMAYRYNVSKTPIRMVLNRLVGEDILQTTPHEGFYMPRVTEQRLRDLHGWTEQILLLSLQTAFPEDITQTTLPSLTFDHEDVVAGTEQLFGAIAGLGGNGEHRRAISSTNDRLRPIRRLPDFSVREREAEFRDLTDAWSRSDVGPLRGLVRAYHRRRLEIIPKIVSLAYREPNEIGDRGLH